MNIEGNDGFYSMIRIGCSALIALLFIAAGCATQPGQNDDAIQAGQSDDAIQAGQSDDDADRVIIVDAEIQKLFYQATILMQQGQFTSAITLLDQVIANEQRLTAPYVNLAIAYDKSGNNEKARDNIDKALAIDRYDPVANNELGLIYRKQGKFEDARKTYSTALEKHPDNLPVVRNLGILCDIYLRDWVCAMEQYEKYQQLVPDDKKVKIWIADLKQRTGG